MRKILKQLSSGVVCFFCGDIFSTGFYLVFGGEFTHFMLKALGTLVIGVIGGLAGLVGKDIYPLIKNYIFQLYQNLKNKNKQSS
jgi:hypothetical protein